MSVARPDAEIIPQLEELAVDLIDPNEGNPRLIFPQDELDRLADSIDQEGILVPIVVFEKGGRYVLIDGERRYRCARTLGHDKVPALVVGEKTERAVLVQMFNIHLIREPWRDMPTAKALGKLVADLEANGEDTSDRALREITGLSIERVRQLRYVLTLPPDWQEYINEGTIPLNFFWELKRNVVDALHKQRPKLYDELGGADAIGQAFVDKRLDGVITDTVGLRKVRPIITFAANDAGEGETSVLDDNLRELVTSSELSIDEVYEDTVQIMVEADKLERRTRAMVASFERLLGKARTEDERAHVQAIGRSFIKTLSGVLK